MMDFLFNYSQTGEIHTNALAKLMKATSPKGTVEPPPLKDIFSKPTQEAFVDFFSGKSPETIIPKAAKGSIIDKVLAAAHSQLGKPYEWGSGPSTASFDCSDLVQWAWKQVGINIPRTTYEQIKVLPKVPWKDLQPGDLIYKNDGGHVVMYVGGGKVIAAPHTGTVVQYQPLSRFDKKTHHVRRVPL